MGIISLIQLAVTIYANYFMPKQGHSDCLTHAHEGLAIGSIVEHQHSCENCQTKYKHTHRIKHPSKSVLYGPHLCKNCEATHLRLLETYQPNGIFVRENPKSKRAKENYGKKKKKKKKKKVLGVDPPV